MANTLFSYYKQSSRCTRKQGANIDVIMKKVLAIIPARSGSKSVKDKNIRLINGKPMLAYSIEHGLQAEKIDRVIVSTDNDKYAEIAKQFGAEVPFLRPKSISLDESLDIEVFEHALNYLKETEDYIPDIVVQLRPTYPIRNVKDIDNMVEILELNDNIDSVRCIAPAKEIAYKMWRKMDNGSLQPLLSDIPEAYNMPRQRLPQIYYQNACIDVIRAHIITEQHSMSGNYIMGYEMNHNFDIDTEEDFKKAENYLKLFSDSKTYVFDIDGVIARYNTSFQYDESLPNVQMINIVNYLFENGNKIVLHTARGYKTGIDWYEVTKAQLEKWGVKYHELKMGKPDADYYVDDKMLDMETLYQCFGSIL